MLTGHLKEFDKDCMIKPKNFIKYNLKLNTL